MLGELVEELRAEGVELRVARMKSAVVEDLAQAGLEDAIGRERFHGTVREAVAAGELTPPG